MESRNIIKEINDFKIDREFYQNYFESRRSIGEVLDRSSDKMNGSHILEEKVVNVFEERKLSVKRKFSQQTYGNIKSHGLINKSKHLVYREKSISEIKLGDLHKIKRIVENAEEYIRRMFGRNFDFSEEYLKSNIDPSLIITAIK